MFVVFRADASLEIGTGHVMRCLTLADSLREMGAECLFVCRRHPGNLVETIESRGFRVQALPLGSSGEGCNGDAADEHAGWLGESWKLDATQTLASMDGHRADWVVVDHYAIGAKWERHVSTGAKRLMVIDDLANRSHRCDLLVDQNLGRTETSYRQLVPAACRVLSGPRYALLRKEFPALRESSLARRQRPKLGRLLIAMGGVDKDNSTGAVLSALVGSGMPSECLVTVVLGKHCPWIEDIRSVASSLPWEVDIHVDTPDMAGLMAASDLAIGGAGSTSWERCCLGVPSIQVVLASNQQEIAAALQAAGAAITVEVSVLASTIGTVLASICKDPSLIGEMSAAAATVTSGQGVLEVRGHMLRNMADEN